MKKRYLQMHGIKGTGFLVSKYALENDTLLRGVALVVNGMQVVSIVHANDGGWVDDNGKVRWFDLDGNSFFMGQLAFKFHLLKQQNTKLLKKRGK